MSSVYLSVMLCTVVKWYILQDKVSEQVNRKCPLRNMMVRLLTPTPTLSP